MTPSVERDLNFSRMFVESFDSCSGINAEDPPKNETEKNIFCCNLTSLSKQIQVYEHAFKKLDENMFTI